MQDKVSELEASIAALTAVVDGGAESTVFSSPATSDHNGDAV